MAERDTDSERAARRVLLAHADHINADEAFINEFSQPTGPPKTGVSVYAASVACVGFEPAQPFAGGLPAICYEPDGAIKPDHTYGFAFAGASAVEVAAKGAPPMAVLSKLAGILTKQFAGNGWALQATAAHDRLVVGATANGPWPADLYDPTVTGLRPAGMLPIVHCRLWAKWKGDDTWRHHDALLPGLGRSSWSVCVDARLLAELHIEVLGSHDGQGGFVPVRTFVAPAY